MNWLLVSSVLLILGIEPLLGSHHTIERKDKEEPISEKQEPLSENEKEISEFSEEVNANAEPVNERAKRFAPYGYFPPFYPSYPAYNPYVPSLKPLGPVLKPAIAPVLKPAVVAKIPIKKPAPVVYPVKVPVAKGPVTGSQTQITFGPDGKPRNQQNNAITSATGATQSQGGFIGADGKLVVSNLQNSLRNFGYYPSFFPSYPSPYAAPSYPSPYAPPAIQKPSYPFPPYPSLPKLGKGPVTGSQTQISFGPDGVIRKKNIQNFNGNQGTQGQNTFIKPDGTVGGGNNQQFSRDLAESEPTILEKIVKLHDVQS